MNFDHVLAGIGARRVEEVDVCRDWCVEARQAQVALEELPNWRLVEVGTKPGNNSDGAAAAQTHNGPRRGARGARESDDGVVEIGESSSGCKHDNLAQSFCRIP